MEVQALFCRLTVSNGLTNLVITMIMWMMLCLEYSVWSMDGMINKLGLSLVLILSSPWQYFSFSIFSGRNCDMVTFAALDFVVIPGGQPNNKWKEGISPKAGRDN